MDSDNGKRQPLQAGIQYLELVDGMGKEPAVMTAGAFEGLEACARDAHCAHHCDDPFPCCRCGALFRRA